MSEEVTLIQQAIDSLPSLWPYLNMGAEKGAEALGKALGDGAGKLGVEKAKNLLDWVRSEVTTNCGPEVLTAPEAPASATITAELFTNADVARLQEIISLASTLKPMVAGSAIQVNTVNGVVANTVYMGDLHFNKP